jgi:hypothetical protein
MSMLDKLKLSQEELNDAVCGLEKITVPLRNRIADLSIEYNKSQSSIVTTIVREIINRYELLKSDPKSAERNSRRYHYYVEIFEKSSEQWEHLWSSEDKSRVGIAGLDSDVIDILRKRYVKRGLGAFVSGNAFRTLQRRINFLPTNLSQAEGGLVRATVTDDTVDPPLLIRVCASWIKSGLTRPSY